MERWCVRSLLVCLCIGAAFADVGMVLNRKWTPWSSWSDCSTSCGDGNRIRSRSCHEPPCSGSYTENQRCYKRSCPEWRAWKAWGPCDRDCEGGYRHRTRDCDDPRSGCRGLSYDVEDCNGQQCPEWTNWTRWSPCMRNIINGPRGPPGSSPPLGRYRDRICQYGTGCGGGAPGSNTRQIQACPAGPRPPPGSGPGSYPGGPVGAPGR